MITGGKRQGLLLCQLLLRIRLPNIALQALLFALCRILKSPGSEKASPNSLDTSIKLHRNSRRSTALAEPSLLCFAVR